MITILRELIRRCDPATRDEPAPSLPRLLPDDAYYDLDEIGRDRVDARLRADANSIPTDPGTYFDREGSRWELDERGAWADRTGRRRAPEYTPIMSVFGPFRTAPSNYAAPAHSGKD